MTGILRLFRKEVGRLTSEPNPIDRDFANIEIDQNLIKATQRAYRHRCSQRLSKGLFFTDAEKKEFMNKMRQISLP